MGAAASLWGFLRGVPSGVYVAAAAVLALWWWDARAYDRGYAAAERAQAEANADVEAVVRSLNTQVRQRQAEVDRLRRELDDEARRDPRAPDRAPTDSELRRLEERFGTGSR